MSNSWADLSQAQKLESLNLFQQGTPADILVEKFDISPHATSTFLRRMRSGRTWADILACKSDDSTTTKTTSVDHDKLMRAIRNKPRSISYLSQQFDRSESTIYESIEELRVANYNIVESSGNIVLDTKSILKPNRKNILIREPTMEITIGVASDTHWGSNEQQITALIQFVDTAYNEFGVREIFVPGDLTAGIDVYRGQFYDLYLYAADTQRDAAIAGFPAHPGLTYHCIGGNHDQAHIRKSGYNIVDAICSCRDDMIYYGFDLADIPLTKNITVRMWHPSGGNSYCVAYRLQKGVEQMALEQLDAAIGENHNSSVAIVLVGHLHTSLFMQMGNIQGFQCGCFEGQTNYLKRKGLYPKVGGWIISLQLTKNGFVKRITPIWESYQIVENDWENYPELTRIREQKEPLPIFEYIPSPSDQMIGNK